MVPDIKGRASKGGTREEVADEDILTQEGGSNRTLAKNAQRGASLFVLLTTYHQNDQIVDGEMGGVCGTYRREDAFVQGFGGGI